MTYETVSEFAQQYGLIYFVILFAGAVVYALWPKNKEKFDRASQVPLRED
ncbi:MAG: cbb3-type cytochrome c oxidase subunit 3 [Hyphomicrobiales bacterium]